MATIYPLTFPAGGIESVDFQAKDIVGEFSSEFAGIQSVVAHTGQRWEVSITSVFMNRADAAEWLAFILALKGKRGTFYFGDPFNPNPRGSAPGTPQIAGASETGEDINTKGWTASQPNIVRKGDWLQVGTGTTRKLVQSLTDANSDVNGNAVLTVYPEIKTAFADSTSIVTASPKGLFRLTTNERVWTERPDGKKRFAIPAREVL